MWPALYTSLAPEIAVWEMVRQRISQGNLLFLENNRLSELRVSLHAVLDCHDPSDIGLSTAALTGADTTLPWSLAAAAIARGTNALLVPSAALTGTNLVIFPNNLPDGWVPEVIGTTEMPLKTPRGLRDWIVDS